MPSWSDAPEEIKKRFPAPPERENYADDESFEEARSYWQGHIGRAVAFAVMQYEGSKRMGLDKTPPIEEIKKGLLAELEEWLGSDVPHQESEDYKKWQERLNAINSIRSIEGVLSYVEGYVPNTEEFIKKWGLSGHSEAGA